MSKWQSKAQIEEQAYQRFYQQIYPELEERMKAFVASYDEKQPVEEVMQTLANFPMALLSRRMAKYCVWPAIRQYEASIGFQVRAVTQCIEQFTKPLQDTYNAKMRAEERSRREAFKRDSQSRAVIVDGMFRQSSDLGEFIIVNDDGNRQVLTCLSCEYIKAEEDIGQFDSGYFCEFAYPTDEEKGTEAYKLVQQALERDLSRKK